MIFNSREYKQHFEWITIYQRLGSREWRLWKSLKFGSQKFIHSYIIWFIRILFNSFVYYLIHSYIIWIIRILVDSFVYYLIHSYTVESPKTDNPLQRPDLVARIELRYVLLMDKQSPRSGPSLYNVQKSSPWCVRYSETPLYLIYSYIGAYLEVSERGGRGIESEEAAATFTILLMHYYQNSEEANASSASMVVTPQVICIFDSFV